jgi:thiamine transport system substrate-binding protein
MKTHVKLAAVVLGLMTVWCFPPGVARRQYAEAADLTIYAYDSFVSEWGPGPKVIPKFEKKHGVKVEVISVGDAGQVLNRAILEKKSPKADLILGIDNNMLTRALEEKVLQPYKPPDLSLVPRELVFDKTSHVTPFDYGYFAVCYDSLKLTDPPKSLEDLIKPAYAAKIILEDPRTSSPGLGFLLWTVAVYGEGYAEYWEKLKANTLTITEGWDSAYGLFTGGEAPMVLSYTTSPAYHVEYEKTTRYRALIFKEGNYLQIEGIGVLKGARNAQLARQFIDFVLSEDFQSEIPLTNWMFPVNPKVKLPDSFRYAPKPEKTLSLDAKEIEKNGKRWIDGWLKAVSE